MTTNKTYDEWVTEVNEAVQDYEDDQGVSGDDVYADIVVSVLWDAPREMAEEVCRTQLGFVPGDLLAHWGEEVDGVWPDDADACPLCKGTLQHKVGCIYDRPQEGRSIDEVLEYHWDHDVQWGTYAAPGYGRVATCHTCNDLIIWNDGGILTEADVI